MSIWMQNSPLDGSFVVKSERKRPDWEIEGEDVEDLQSGSGSGSWLLKRGRSRYFFGYFDLYYLLFGLWKYVQLDEVSDERRLD